MIEPKDNLDNAIYNLLELYNKWNEKKKSINRSNTFFSDKNMMALEIVAKKLIQEPGLIEKIEENKLTICFEIQIISLILTEKKKQNEKYVDIEKQLINILKIDSEKARSAGGKIISYFLLALDDISEELKEKIFILLTSLTKREVGIKSKLLKKFGFNLSFETQNDLSKLLDYGLFSEVFTFMKGLPALREASNANGLKEIKSTVISIASRKGGVGKSSLAFAIALIALRKKEKCRICLIDLDITGPVWQYLLCPNDRMSDGQPMRYLNQLLNIEQSELNFDFGDHDINKILECVIETEFPFLKQKVGLLTFRDLPRTNRFIVQAIANNRNSFSSFLINILRAISSKYDLIIIDNTPGFDPHPLISIVFAGSTPKGLPIVISTEQAPDLRGTFLELSDLKLLSLNVPPLWIVNKASEKAVNFFSKPHTLVEIAEKNRGYAEIMPDAPILKQLLEKQEPSKLALPIAFDEKLARPNENSIDFANPITKESIDMFISSYFFKKLEEELANNSSFNF